MSNLRPLTDTEIEVILDRIFSGQNRTKTKKGLKKMLVNPDGGTLQAGCNVNLDYDTLVDLAELKDRREADLLKEAKDITGENDEQKLLTPQEWLDKYDIPNSAILDPDGWDRKNFDESWNEKITKSEMQKRVSASTVNFRLLGDKL